MAESQTACRVGAAMTHCGHLDSDRLGSFAQRILDAMIRLLIPSALIAIWGTAMADQTLLPLNESDLKRLEEQRAVVTRHLNEDSLEKYETAAGKLGALRALLRAKVFSPEQTYELQSMGVVLGDVFVQDMGFHWIIVQDEYGRDPAIQFRDTSVLLFPLTMISKRIEQGEPVDVFDLYNGVAAIAQEKIDAELAR